MAKYYIVGGSVKRPSHIGLIVTAYYKQDPENKFEKPERITMFNRWPPAEMEADVIDVPLNGVYEYPNGFKTDHVHSLCPKTKEGAYYQGWSPQEILANVLHVLTKVEQKA